MLFRNKKTPEIRRDDIYRIHELIDEWYTEEIKWFGDVGDVGLLLQNLCATSLSDCTWSDLQEAGRLVRPDHPYTPIIRLNNLIALLEMELGSSVMNTLSRNWVGAVMRLSTELQREEVENTLRRFPALMLLPFIMHKTVDRLRKST